MNATPVPAMSSFALRHCTWRTWHQRSRIASCGIFALECVSGSLRSNTTCCIWHHFLYVFMYVCSGEHPRVRPELWLQRLWRFHRRNRRGAIEGAPVSTPIRFNQRAADFRNIASMNLRVFILKSAGGEHIALPIGNT